MIIAVADNIYSPLGTTSRENLDAVVDGRARVFLHAQVHGCNLQQPFVGSLLEQLPAKEGYSHFESLCIASIEKALDGTSVTVADSSCVFVVSTTKGDIWTSPAESAQRIAQYFGNTCQPVVVSTACTSGVSAQLVAYRLLSQGLYRTAVVVGCDVQQEFIVSGFQSFKALSDEPCRPFDAQRNGLNAGEAAATLILQFADNQPHGVWRLLGGSIHNDANHISGPSRTAEGSWRCLKDSMALLDGKPALLSVHGTGTLYNDEMESIAIHRAGLDDVPISALKGYYGHTMGAAGLMETILSMHALQHHWVLPAKGYAEQGTSNAVNISSKLRSVEGSSFIKLLSGFGGVNAAAAWTLTGGKEQLQEQSGLTVLASVSLTPADNLVELYRERVGGYPKFFKMDTLSRLGFVAVEMLLQKVHEEYPDLQLNSEQTAIILANHSASLKNDTDYQQTIVDKDNYFPSPALFVYTLPNIVTGELAIRHHLYGETAFYVLGHEDELEPLVLSTMTQPALQMAIVGWLECTAADQYKANVKLIMKGKALQ